MRPNSLLVRTYVRRGAAIWLFTRLIVTVVSLYANAGPARPSPVLSAELIAVAVALGFLETIRHRERALLGNLGIGSFVLAGLFAAPALAGEVIAGLCYTAL